MKAEPCWVPLPHEDGVLPGAPAMCRLNLSGNSGMSLEFHWTPAWLACFFPHCPAGIVLLYPSLKGYDACSQGAPASQGSNEILATPMILMEPSHFPAMNGQLFFATTALVIAFTGCASPELTLLAADLMNTCPISSWVTFGSSQ